MANVVDKFFLNWIIAILTKIMGKAYRCNQEQVALQLDLEERDSSFRFDTYRNKGYFQLGKDSGHGDRIPSQMFLWLELPFHFLVGAEVNRLELKMIS